jgi:GNAT superfamily N-acetyltransferase
MNSLLFREAYTSDIPAMQFVRHAVKENVLSNPGLVTDADCKEYIQHRGKGWVCEIDNTIVGFAIADLKEESIWALFVHPDYEQKGIGSTLQNIMLDWYFLQGPTSAWLVTAPKTRAETFYTKSGWINIGIVHKGEVKFEMSKEQWKNLRQSSLNALKEQVVIKRTDSSDPALLTLIPLLDAYLRDKDGEEHAFFASHNKIDHIRNIVIATIGERPIACGAFKPYENTTAEIKRMFVDVDARGLGIASSILQELESWAKELDYKECILETGIRMPEAIALYKKHGYEIIPNYGQYIGVAISVCMQKKLI